MSELAKLIEAAEKGAIEDVKAIAQSHPELINQPDGTGATPLHYAAFGGHRDVVRFLVQQGADINARDGQFGATPAGWAIEYMREMGGFLEIELRDMAFAIRRGDVDWVARFLKRFPNLREARDSQGNSFRQLAEQSGNAEIARLFDSRTAS
jgi:ankyrin repeat protein